MEHRRHDVGVASPGAAGRGARKPSGVHLSITTSEPPASRELTAAGDRHGVVEGAGAEADQLGVQRSPPESSLGATLPIGPMPLVRVSSSEATERNDLRTPLGRPVVPDV